jgi:hypothetical protein
MEAEMCPLMQSTDHFQCYPYAQPDATVIAEVFPSVHQNVPPEYRPNLRSSAVQGCPFAVLIYYWISLLGFVVVCGQQLALAPELTA